MIAISKVTQLNSIQFLPSIGSYRAMFCFHFKKSQIRKTKSKAERQIKNNKPKYERRCKR